MRERWWRLEGAGPSRSLRSNVGPNIGAGYSGNDVKPGLYGATIGGGGQSTGTNHVAGGTARKSDPSVNSNRVIGTSVPTAGRDDSFSILEAGRFHPEWIPCSCGAGERRSINGAGTWIDVQ